jgi:hypothetical protein
VPEGLSPAEVSKEIAEHKKHADAGKERGQDDRWQPPPTTTTWWRSPPSL